MYKRQADITAVGTNEGKVNYHTTGDAGKTAGDQIGAGRQTEGGERGLGNVENLAGTAAAAATATKELSEEGTPLTLPDVVGAGGFAELLPLLDATIGRWDKAVALYGSGVPCYQLFCARRLCNYLQGLQGRTRWSSTCAMSQSTPCWNYTFSPHVLFPPLRDAPITRVLNKCCYRCIDFSEVMSLTSAPLPLTHPTTNKRNKSHLARCPIPRRRPVTKTIQRLKKRAMQWLMLGSFSAENPAP